MSAHLRSIAFYLPQYHPIPENDEWWGPGFTDWLNVTKARPSFRGHHQPRLPADLGFYDLRVAETRAQQAQLAQAHGIHGFCYFHYWFRGRRLLERPVQEVLETGEPSLPVLLCWANENWTRAWSGSSSDVLLEQTYSPEDDLDHIRWLCKVFSDRRYVRVDGKPVFLVYRASRLPDARRTTDTWRTEAHRLGIGDLYLLRVESFREPQESPTSLGFDGAVEFQPDLNFAGPRIPSRAWRGLRRLTRLENGRSYNHLHRYSDLVDRSLGRPPPDYKRYPCVAPSWDNTPRHTPSLILDGARPAEFLRWVKGAVDRFVPYSADENLMFVNAWNEWGEGNILEPCQRFGRGFLEAHRDGLGVAAGQNRKPTDGTEDPSDRVTGEQCRS